MLAVLFQIFYKYIDHIFQDSYRGYLSCMWAWCLSYLYAVLYALTVRKHCPHISGVSKSTYIRPLIVKGHKWIKTLNRYISILRIEYMNSSNSIVALSFINKLWKHEAVFVAGCNHSYIAHLMIYINIIVFIQTYKQQC